MWTRWQNLLSEASARRRATRAVLPNVYSQRRDGMARFQNSQASDRNLPVSRIINIHLYPHAHVCSQNLVRIL